jgi:AraC-like DNA-binding protein
MLTGMGGPAGVAPSQEYVERAPARALAGLVSTAWVQAVAAGAPAYVQRHVPSGAVELHWRPGTRPRLIGPLTAPLVEEIAPCSAAIGVRFRPGCAGPALGVPASELTGEVVALEQLWGRPADELEDRLSAAASPHDALDVLEAVLARRVIGATAPDALVLEAVGRLMPWQPVDVRSLSSALFISEAQLRRRCHAAVGVSPKVLQRILRFQGFLALVQQAIAQGRAPGEDGLALLAADVGYADQSHLTRECVRLTGVAPRAFVGRTAEACACGHDHSVSMAAVLGLRAPRRAARAA